MIQHATVYHPSSEGQDRIREASPEIPPTAASMSIPLSLYYTKFLEEPAFIYMWFPDTELVQYMIAFQQQFSIMG